MREALSDHDSRDFFIQHPPMQPKREIVEYVGERGFQVGRSFASLEEALEALPESKIFMRSEHPQDYDGASDLLMSFGFRGFSEDAQRFGLSTEEYMARILSLAPFDNQAMSEFFGFNGEPYTGPNKVTMSFWEKIQESAKIVIAKDPARVNTYHVMYAQSIDPDMHGEAYSNSLKASERAYVVRSEDEEEVHQGALTINMRTKIDDVIRAFEEITALPRLSQNHCYSAEFVIDENGDHVLVQVHRGQDMQESQDAFMDHDQFGPEWVTADFVIGRTSPEGIISKVNRAAYGNDLHNSVIEHGAAFFVNRALGRAATEWLALNSSIYIHGQPKDFVLGESVGGHGSRSGLFRPPLSIILPDSHGLRQQMYDRESLLVEIVSDGRIAKIRTVED